MKLRTNAFIASDPIFWIIIAALTIFFLIFVIVEIEGSGSVPLNFIKSMLGK